MAKSDTVTPAVKICRNFMYHRGIRPCKLACRSTDHAKVNATVSANKLIFMSRKTIANQPIMAGVIDQTYQ